MKPINTHNTHIITKTFEYHQPKTIEEATILLSELPGVKPLSGGTDLIPKIKQRIIEPENIVNLKKIPELYGIKENKSSIFIGAATKLRAIERNQTIQNKLPLLYRCIKSIGSVQIRNMGTLGGNICNASPAADGALGLITLDSTVQISGLRREREIQAKNFFTGPESTVLEKGELVKGFTIPVPNEEKGSCFISIGRTALDISTVSIALIMLVKNEKVKDIAIGFGSVAPIPLRLDKVEEWLKEKKLTKKIVKEAAVRVSEGISPITDIRGTSEYRHAAAKGIFMEAITRSWRGEGRVRK
jgi:carbon-monoxide dehydrogenase medium subunit